MRAVAALVITVGLLAAAGCSADDPTPKTPQGKAKASAAASAAAASSAAVATENLQAAVAELAATSYKYTFKAGQDSGGGSVDAAKKQSSLTITVPTDGEPYRTDVVTSGAELYLKIGGLPLPGLDGKKWYRVDRSKIKSLKALGIADVDDPTGVKTLSTTIAAIQKTGAHAYQGTLDLSKGSAAFGLDDASVRQLADRAKNVPFEATTTDQGKLASWKMTVPAHGTEKDTSYELTFTDQGAPVTVTKPAPGEVADPPEAMYEMLQV